MARLTSLFKLLAAATVVATAQAFTPCVEDVDICGWELQQLGYDNEWLSWAAGEAGQDPGVGTHVYDSIYNCYDGGETIIWSAWCGGGGECDKRPSDNVSALCKNEPVWTGKGEYFDYGRK